MKEGPSEQGENSPQLLLSAAQAEVVFAATR